MDTTITLTIFGYLIAAIIGGVLALWGIWSVIGPRRSK